MFSQYTFLLNAMIIISIFAWSSWLNECIARRYGIYIISIIQIAIEWGNDWIEQTIHGHNEQIQLFYFFCNNRKIIWIRLIDNIWPEIAKV